MNRNDGEPLEPATALPGVHLPSEPTVVDSIGVVDLAKLADIANKCHAEVQDACGVMVRAAIRAGDALLAAKDQVPHGGWVQWVTQNFNGSLRCAQTYMQLARANAQAPALFDTAYTIEEALRMISKPRGGNGGDPPPGDPVSRRFGGHLSNAKREILAAEKVCKQKNFSRNADKVYRDNYGDIESLHDDLDRVAKLICTGQLPLFPIPEHLDYYGRAR
jgi:hypothetical protein